MPEFHNVGPDRTSTLVVPYSEIEANAALSAPSRPVMGIVEGGQPIGVQQGPSGGSFTPTQINFEMS